MASSLAQVLEISVHPGRSLVSRALIEKRSLDNDENHVALVEAVVEAALAKEPTVEANAKPLDWMTELPRTTNSTAMAISTPLITATASSTADVLLYVDQHLAAALAAVVVCLFILRRATKKSIQRAAAKSTSRWSECGSLAALSEQDEWGSGGSVTSSGSGSEQDDDQGETRKRRWNVEEIISSRKRARHATTDGDDDDDDSYLDPILAQLQAQAALAWQQANHAAESFSRVSSSFHRKASSSRSTPLAEPEIVGDSPSRVARYPVRSSSVFSGSISVVDSADDPPTIIIDDDPKEDSRAVEAVNEVLPEPLEEQPKSALPHSDKEELATSVVEEQDEPSKEEPVVIKPGEPYISIPEEEQDPASISSDTDGLSSNWDDICVPPQEEEEEEEDIEHDEEVVDAAPKHVGADSDECISPEDVLIQEHQRKVTDVPKRVRWASSQVDETTSSSSGSSEPLLLQDEPSINRGADLHSTPTRVPKKEPSAFSESSPTSIRELFLDPLPQVLHAENHETETDEDPIFCNDDLAAELLTTITPNEPITQQDRQDAMKGLVLPAMRQLQRAAHSPPECRRVSLPKGDIRQVERASKPPLPSQRRATSTATRRLSESVEGRLAMMNIANMERDLYQKVRTKLSQRQISTKKIKVKPSCKKRLQNAKLLVRVVLGGDQRDQLHGAAAVLQALDKIAEFKMETWTKQEELTKAETVFVQLQDEWSKVVENTDPVDDSIACDGHATDIYDHALQQVHKVHQLLRPRKAASTSSAVRKLLPTEKRREKEPSLLDGIVGVWSSQTSSKRSSVSNPNLPLALQDSNRVVKSILGHDLTEVSSRDSLKAIQVFGMLKLQSKRIDASLEAARDRFQDLNTELYRLHELIFFQKHGKEEGVTYFDHATDASIDEVMNDQLRKVTAVLDCKLY